MTIPQVDNEESPEVSEKPEISVEELKQKIQENLDLAKRARADYENLQKETEKWKAAFVKFANEALLYELVSILDHFYEAEGHIPKSEKSKDWVVGIMNIRKLLDDLLQKEGIERFGAVGDAFDPNLHSAIEEVEDAAAGTGKIVKIVRHGYTLHEKVLRAGEVVVGK